MSIADKFEVIADAVYEKGRATAMTAFWEALQNHGNGVYQLYRQFYRWTDEAYYPIYPIKSVGSGTSMAQMFYSSYITNTKVPIFAEGFSLGACFSWSTVETIPLLVVDEATVLDTCFNNALEITNLTIEGTLACNVAMGSCSKLTRDSILGELATEEQIAEGKNLCAIGNNTYYGGIFGALKDFSAEGTNRTLTLHATARARITEDEIAYAQNKGWTVA